MDKMNSKRNKPTTPTRTGPTHEEPPDPKRTFTGGTVMDEDMGGWPSTTEAAAAADAYLNILCYCFRVKLDCFYI